MPWNKCQKPIYNKSLLSFVPRLSTWHCPHLLLSAPAGGTWRRRQQLSIDISCLQGAQQQDGRRCCCRRTGQTDGRTPDRYTDLAVSVNNEVRRAGVRTCGSCHLECSVRPHPQRGWSCVGKCLNNTILVKFLTLVDFYRAMLCIRGTSHGPVSVCPPVCLSVCLSIRPSQVGVLLKRLNVGSHK